jgi:CopG family nickel-responsive transcriptional regulator
MAEMERVSLAMEGELLEKFDAWIERTGRSNRSEAIRDLVRERLAGDVVSKGRRQCVATLTLVYDHKQRELSERLLEVGHHHHNEVMATLHLHLDQDHCLEVQALRGKPKELERFTGQLTNMRGVKHAHLVITPENV